MRGVLTDRDKNKLSLVVKHNRQRIFKGITGVVNKLATIIRFVPELLTFFYFFSVPEKLRLHLYVIYKYLKNVSYSMDFD